MPQSEFIPDCHDLYRRVLPIQHNRTTGKFVAAAFTLRKKKREKALSVNWSKYITAEETSVDPNPLYLGRRFYVGALQAKVPRKHGLRVVHTPKEKNDPHSSIKGKKLIDSPFEMAEILAENCRPLITSTHLK